VPPDAGRALFGYRAGENVSTFQDKIANAKLPRLTVPICLRGDLVAEIERLDRELVAASSSPSTGMEDGARLRELAERIEDLRTEMREDGNNHDFVLQALPGRDYRALKAQHPPRLDDEGDVVAGDRLLGANIDTLAEPLLRACCVDPELDDATWRSLEPVLTDGQYDQLVNAALLVNQGKVTVPFSRAASKVMRSTEPA
jgi:hypothetical protein